MKMRRHSKARKQVLIAWASGRYWMKFFEWAKRQPGFKS